MKTKKARVPKPRPVLAWAIMHQKTRALTGVYVGGYSKNYVEGDCLSDLEIPVRVRVIPA